MVCLAWTIGGWLERAAKVGATTISAAQHPLVGMGTMVAEEVGATMDTKAAVAVVVRSAPAPTTRSSSQSGSMQTALLKRTVLLGSCTGAGRRPAEVEVLR